MYTRWVGKAIRKKPVTGSETLIGKTGIVTRELAPEGEVSMDGIIWKARLTGPFSNKLESGARVVVVRRSGLTLEVEPEPIKQKVGLQEAGSM